VNYSFSQLGEDYIPVREPSSNNILLRNGNASREGGLLKAIVYGGERVDEKNKTPSNTY